MNRILLALLTTLALGGGIAASGADFTANAASPGNTFATAADFNTVAVSVSVPAGPLAGTRTVTASASSDRGIATLTIQYAPSGTADWTDVCATTSCQWDTTAAADGVYDVRAVATDDAGYTRTSTLATRTLDNFTLAVALADPGANVSGNKTLTATATGVASGLQYVKIQHRAVGSSTWIDLCTSATPPKSCDLPTASYSDGPREVRAIARDNSGASAQTAVFSPNVDNSPPQAAASIPDTGRGVVSMNATVSDSGSGIAWVAWEALYQGAWYEFCRDTTAPYTCSGDSAQVADGTYSVRVRAHDNAGVETVTVGSSITIDNAAPAPADVQAGNGGVAGQLGAGDWIRLTWNEPIKPSSVLAGWNGSSAAVRVKLADSGTNDLMDFYDPTGTTRLNLVATATDLKPGADYVSGAVEFNATIAQSAGSITVTLGAPVGSPTLPTAGAGTMTWKPSASATDLSGNPSGTGLVTESGAADVDF